VLARAPHVAAGIEAGAELSEEDRAALYEAARRVVAAAVPGP